ncbi:hypothetical protein [Ascidiimonas sp. W6]|uniref:hypothetical protein n=1 Tax=Ascidiimonas meishanensis TaxID=3128903 RepID=UPI0030EBAB89
MKPIIRLKQVVFVVLSVFLFINCEQETEDQEPLFFLSEIRPAFFENLNFESPEVVGNIVTFRTQLATTYESLEEAYLNQEYKSESDLEYMRLAGMYYSFYLLALGGNYNDEYLTFKNIMGNPEIGYYSGLSSSTPDFEQKELEAMMAEAVRVSKLAYQINGYNDKAYGFHVSIKQVEGRLKNRGMANDAETQDQAIDYVGVQLVNFDLLPDWNVLMAMVTFTNYADSLNTFKNPRMNDVLFNVNARLVPGLLPDLGGLYPEILGPLYRFDLNLKKIDWYIQTTEEFTMEQILELDTYIETLEGATNFIEKERSEILKSWDALYTFEMRKEKLMEVKQYSAQLKEGRTNIQKPALETFINSNEFKKAYQCYSCHKPTGLIN